MANTGYTRNLTFTVNDKQIKKATDRLFQSLDKIEKKIDQVVGKYNREVQVTYSASERVAKSVNTQLVAWKAVQETAKIAGGLVAAMYTGLLAVKGGVEGLVKWWQQLNETIGQTLQRQRKPLNELNAFVSKLRSEMEGYHSSSEKAKNTALQLASVLKVQVKEQAALNNLVNQGLGPVASGMRGRLPKDPETGVSRLGSRNRVFGRRYVGTPDEEEAKMRNRRINERRSRAIDARFWKEKRANQKAEQASSRELLRLEKARTAAVQEQLSAKTTETTVSRTRMESLGFGKNANPKGAFASQRGMAGRLAGAGQSAMIGGGFPLLFGQSPTTAVAGGVGGALGGLLGSGFGFAGSIVGTALASAIQDAINFQKSIDAVNRSIRSTGSESFITAKSIRTLASNLNITKEEALAATNAFAQFGGEARIALAQSYGKDPSTFYGLAAAKDTAQVLQQISELRAKDNAIGDQKAKQLLQILRTEGAIATKIELKALADDRAGQLEKAREITIKDRVQQLAAAYTLSQNIGTALEGESAKLADINYYGNERVKDLEKQFAIQDQVFEKEKEWLKQLENATKYAALKAELESLLDPMNQLITVATGIGDAFSSSFKGIVSGSMTAQQALANLFQKTADMFLDMAAQMIAKQIQMKILGIGLNFIGNTVPSGSFGSGSGTVGSGFGSAVDTNIGRHVVGHSSIQPKALGGPVSGGSPYIVGEKGPELFVPGSSGNIVPNHAMGGTNVVVNVDASGSSVEGDVERSRQLGELIGAAVQSEIIRQKRPGGTLF